MKFLILLLVSFSAFGAVTVNKKKLNSNISFEDYRINTGNCDVIASVTLEKERTPDLKIVSVKKGEPLQKGYESCSISKDEYKSAVKEFMAEYKGKKLGEFITGYLHNPIDSEWESKLALASANDKQFKQMKTEGEKKVTFNKVFSRLIKEKSVFASFIEFHKSLGINLEYVRAEKIFREDVKNSKNKKALKAAGLKDNDQYISGAALIFFKVK